MLNTWYFTEDVVTKDNIFYGLFTSGWV